MQLTAFGKVQILLIFLLATLGHVQAQDAGPRITLQEKNVPLKKVLTDISRKTNFSLLYDEALIAGLGTVSVDVTDASLTDVLRECLKGKALSFAIEGNTISIRRQSVSSSTPDNTYRNARINIVGKVSDDQNLPLAGVTIVIRGTDFKLATLAGGDFSMSGIPDQGVIVFTSIGYQTLELKYDRNTDFHVKLKKRVTTLGTVSVQVNNGYQVTPLSKTTGSVDVIDNQLFNRSVSTNILDHMDGVASGVNFDNREDGSIKSFVGQGNTKVFYIRGLSTVNSSTFPLVIVDGFPYNSDQPYFQNINNLNPNDIESLTILKDAAAASIWGARAGNGVVVITTKSGKYNQKPQVSANTSVTVTGKPRLFTQRILSTSDYIGIEKSLFAQGNYSTYFDPSTADGKPVTPVVDLLNQVSNGTLSQADADNQIAALSKIDVRRDELKYFYTAGVDQQYNVSLKGGSPNDHYFLSAGFDDGKAVDFSFQRRFTLTSGYTFRPFSGLEIGIPLTITDNQMGTNVGNLQGLSGIAPYTKLTDASGRPVNVAYGPGYNQSFIQTALNDGLYDVSYNPINQFHAAQYTHTSSQLLQISPEIRYSIKGGWSADAKYQYSRTSVGTKNYQSDSVWSVKNMINNYTQIEGPGQLVYPINQGGILTIGNSEQVNNNLRLTLGYDHQIAADHHLNVIAGYERNEIKITGNQDGWYGYNPNSGTIQSVVDYVTYWPQTNQILANSPYPYTSPVYPAANASITQQFTAFISSFAKADYIYRDRYILSGSARLDQANLFGVDANNKKKVLWSGGAAWEINKEPFYRFKGLSLLKLRATYGFQGNVPSASYRSQTTINYYSSTIYSSGVPTAILNNPPNPNLTWERIGQVNLGLDFATKGNVLTGTIEYYQKKGTGLVVQYPVDPTSGVLQLAGNVGSMSAHGLDLTLESKNIVTKNFRWTTRLLFSHNTDKLTKYNVVTTATEILQEQAYSSYPSIPTAIRGNAVYGIYSSKWAGLDNKGNPQGYDTLGKVSEDYNQLTSYARIKDLVYHGSGLPTYFGSLMDDFTFKGFTLSVNISYKLGYYFHAQSVNYSSLLGYQSNLLSVSDGSSDYDKRWQQPGDEQHTHVPSIPTLANNNYQRDEFYQFSSVLVQRGDNIRLKDISLSYDFTSLTKRTSPFSGVQLYGYYVGNMLLWKANKMGIDPDFATMKPARSYTLGLRLALK